MKKLDLLDMDLETVTRFSPLDIDGPCQWMRTWSAIGPCLRSPEQKMSPPARMAGDWKCP